MSAQTSLESTTIRLGELYATPPAIDPRKLAEEFDLYSIPAYEAGTPEVRRGHDIGSAKLELQPGDILLSRIVPHIRRAWVVGAYRGRRQLGSGEWIVFRGANVYGPYLRHYFLSNRFHAEYMTTVAGVGGSLLRARPAAVAKLRMHVPSVAEQRRIAAILDQAVRLQLTSDAQRQKITALGLSIFLQMFGDPASNPKGWPRIPMAGLFRESPIFGTMVPGVDEPRPWLNLRVANIQNGALDLSDKKFVDLPNGSINRHSVTDGDLLMARAIATQEHLGKAIVVYPGETKWAFDSHLMRLRFDSNSAEPEYINYLLKSAGGRSLFLKVTRRSAVQFNINTGEISSLIVPVAPVELQQKFVRLLRQVSNLRERAVRASGKLGAMYTSLQHRAFRGEL